MSKNKDLGFEASKMWDMKTEIIPVVVGALGLTKKGLDKESRVTLAPMKSRKSQCLE